MKIKQSGAKLNLPRKNPAKVVVNQLTVKVKEQSVILKVLKLHPPKKGNTVKVHLRESEVYLSESKMQLKGKWIQTSLLVIRNKLVKQ